MAAISGHFFEHLGLTINVCIIISGLSNNLHINTILPDLPE